MNRRILGVPAIFDFHYAHLPRALLNPQGNHIGIGIGRGVGNGSGNGLGFGLNIGLGSGPGDGLGVGVGLGDGYQHFISVSSVHS